MIKRPEDFKLLHPQCLDINALNFLGSDYIFYPCCFTRVGEFRQEFHDRLGSDLEQFDIRKYSHQQILDSAAWSDLVKSFDADPMRICLMMCGKKDRPYIKADNSSGYDGRNAYRAFKPKNKS